MLFTIRLKYMLFIKPYIISRVNNYSKDLELKFCGLPVHLFTRYIDVTM